MKTFYDIDTPVTLARLSERGETEYLKAEQIPLLRSLLQLYRRTDAERDRAAVWRGHGAAALLQCRSGEVLSLSCRKRYMCEMSYMGTYAADRQRKSESMLCETARQLPECSFIVAGPQYPKSLKWPANVKRIMHLNPRWHPHLYSSSRLSLNVTRQDMVAAGFSPSVRLFEAAACAAHRLRQLARAGRLSLPRDARFWCLAKRGNRCLPAGNA